MEIWDKQLITFRHVHLSVKVFSWVNKGETIDENLVLHICDAPSADEIKEILKLAESKDLNSALLRMHAIF